MKNVRSLLHSRFCWLGRMLNVHDVTRQNAVRRRRKVEEQRLINHGVRYIGTIIGRR